MNPSGTTTSAGVHGGQNWLSFRAIDCGNDRVWTVETSRHGEALSKIRYVNSSPAM